MMLLLLCSEVVFRGDVRWSETFGPIILTERVTKGFFVEYQKRVGSYVVSAPSHFSFMRHRRPLH